MSLMLVLMIASNIDCDAPFGSENAVPVAAGVPPSKRRWVAPLELRDGVGELLVRARLPKRVERGAVLERGQLAAPPEAGDRLLGGGLGVELVLPLGPCVVELRPGRGVLVSRAISAQTRRFPRADASAA